MSVLACLMVAGLPQLAMAAAAKPAAPVPEFPVPPDKHLGSIRSLPNHEGVLLEVGDSVGTQTATSMIFHSNVSVFDLASGAESRWDLPEALLSKLAPTGGGQRASWANNAGQLLFATGSEISLISKAGVVKPLAPHMPGHLKPLDGMENYALSPDGKYLAYYLMTRDAEDKQSNGFGRLYQDLMIQSTEGSSPVSLMHGTRPASIAWAPDSSRLAYGTYTGDLVILSLSGKTLYSGHPGANTKEDDTTDAIMEVRWSPDGRKLAFIMGANHGLNTIGADGSNFRAVDFSRSGVSAKDNAMFSFAWSPDGRRFAFSSRYKASQKCNEQALGYAYDTGHFPCLNGSNLFTSAVDGSDLKRITQQTDYNYASPGELFWIQ
jgi:WD40 repeat protein